ILARTWRQTGPHPGSPEPAGRAVRSNGSLLLEPGPASAGPASAGPAGTGSAGAGSPGGTRPGPPSSVSGAGGDSRGRLSKRARAIGVVGGGAPARAAAAGLAL